MGDGFAIVCAAAYAVVLFAKYDRLGRGVLSRPVVRAFRCSPQALLVLIYRISVALVMPGGRTYWLVLFVFLADDVIFGDDDDRWKRRRRWVRNTLRWRMAPPVAIQRPT